MGGLALSSGSLSVAVTVATAEVFSATLNAASPVKTGAVSAGAGPTFAVSGEVTVYPVPPSSVFTVRCRRAATPDAAGGRGSGFRAAGS